MKNSWLKMALEILIAEDNQYTALQYNRILGKYGHSVVITKDGDECIKKYKEEMKKKKSKKQGSTPFDVVILDQSMPKKTGKEVADEILESSPNQRIIFASAYALGSQSEVSKEFEENVEFLQKPFSLEKFVKRIGN